MSLPLPLRQVFRVSILCLMAFASPLASASAAENVFASFAGAWSGPGTLVMTNGQTQQINCRLTNVVGAAGTTLDQSLDCASDASKLQLTASYIYSAGALSGSWSEASHGTRGNLSGQAQVGRIRATVAGIGFVGGLGMSTRGRQQSVTFQAQGGGDIKKVSISLHKV